MGKPLEISKQAYAAFGNGDIPALLDLLADDVEWRFLARSELGTPYGGMMNDSGKIARWFGTEDSAARLDK